MHHPKKCAQQTAIPGWAWPPRVRLRVVSVTVGTEATVQVSPWLQDLEAGFGKEGAFTKGHQDQRAPRRPPPSMSFQS